MFEQKQVQEFKEAFGLMDQDRDGSISLDDLKEVYSSLGKAPKDTDLKQMLEETGGPVNFTKLLTLFGDRLNGKVSKTMGCSTVFISSSFRYGRRRYSHGCFQDIRCRCQRISQSRQVRLLDMVISSRPNGSFSSLRDLLTSMGKPDERLSDVEVSEDIDRIARKSLSSLKFTQMLEGAPLDTKGLLDYAAFTKLIKRGKEDD